MGEAHGYKIKKGQNPNGVQQSTPLFYCNKCSTPSGLCYAIRHSPWVTPMAMDIQPLRGLFVY